MSKNSIKYTVKKFSAFLPYVLIALLMRTIFLFSVRDTTGSGISMLFSMIMQALLISWQPKYVYTLWFLSTMFVIFPIFCCLCQIKAKHFLYILSFTFSIGYYNLVGLGTDSFYTQLGRCAAGLLLGVLAYYVVSIIRQINFSNIQRVLLTGIEQGLLIFVVLSMYMNKDYYSILLFCMFISLCLMLSGKTCTNNINNRFLNYLGRTSIVIYLIHAPVLSIIDYLKLPPLYSQVVSVSITLILSFVISAIVENLKNRIRVPKFGSIDL